MSYELVQLDILEMLHREFVHAMEANNWSHAKEVLAEVEELGYPEARQMRRDYVRMVCTMCRGRSVDLSGKKCLCQL